MKLNEISLDNIDVSVEPPLEEPERQYYYMAKCREWVHNETIRRGRPLTCMTVTFGCPMVSITKILKPYVLVAFTTSALILFYILGYILMNFD